MDFTLPLPRDVLPEGLTVEDLQWLVRQLKKKFPSADWRSIKEKIEDLISMEDPTMRARIVQWIMDKMRAIAGSAVDELLAELRSFSVVVDMPDGSPLTIGVRPYARVSEVKLKVAAKSRIPAGRQRLFHNAVELQDGDTLEQRLIGPGERLCLIDASALDIFVKGLTARTYVVRGLTAANLVSDLKRRIHEKEGVAPSEQVLTFQSRVLENARSIGSYGIRSGSTVFLTLRLRGGDF